MNVRSKIGNLPNPKEKAMKKSRKKHLTCTMASGMELKLFAIHFLLTMTATMMGFPLQSVHYKMLTFRLGTRVVSAAGKTHVPVGFPFLGKRFHYGKV
jgi:hypothetical protein